MNTRFFIFVTSLLTITPITQASISLSFDTPVQTAQSLDLGIIISGLDNTALGTYDLNIQFDPTHLSYIATAFGDPFLGNQLDLFDIGLNETQANIISPGEINIFELSLDLPEEQNDLQPNTFILATLTFEVLKASSSEISYGLNILGDSFGDSLSATLISAQVSTVPLPSAFWFMGSALAWLYQKRSTGLDQSNSLHFTQSH